MPTLSTLIGLRRALLGGAAAAALAALPAQALPVYAGTAQTNPGGATPLVTASGSTVNVDLRANRTILDWTSFNVQPGETASFYFDQRNWIALNRVSGSSISINGAVNGIQAAGVGAGPTGGNVWFYSPQGVAFGPNARVNVAGLLATSSAVNTAAFLTVNGQNIPFTGGGGGPITVAAGAQLNSSHHVALIAPSVTTAAGSTFTSGDSGTVLYGAADSFEVQLFPANLDWTIFTFIVQNAAAGTPVGVNALNLAGDTRSGTIYLAAYSRAALAGQVINAPGLLVAQSSIKEYGQVTITTGRSIILGQVGVANENQQVTGVATGSANISGVDAGGNVNIYLTGTGSLGDLTVAGGIHAGQGLSIAVNNLTTGAAGIRVGDSAFDPVSTRNMALDTRGTITTPLIDVRGNLTIAPGVASNGRGSALPTLRLGTVNAGGNILFSNANSIDAGAIAAGGEAQLFGALPVRIASLTTNGYTRISSSQTITVAGAVRGADIDLRSAQGISAASLVGTNSVMVGTAGPADFASITGPSLLMDAATARLGTVTIGGDARLRVTNPEILTGFTARNLTFESQTGALTLGGSQDAMLTDAEFQRIRVTGAVNLYGGLTAATVNVPTPVYGDVTVGDLTVDAAKIPRLNIFAHSTRDVRVSGALSPVGAAVLQIGDSVGGTVWRPQAIRVTGALGAARGDAVAGFTDVRGFRAVELYASRDIFLGSQRFIDLVGPVPASGIDIARGLPQGVAATGDEIGRVFVVSGSLKAVANDRIVQQNTGAPGLEGGLYLTGEGVPAGEPLLTVAGADVADVFGAFLVDGVLTSGKSAAFLSRIAVSNDGDAGVGFVRINGCALGVGCALSTPASQFRIESFSAPAPATAAIDPPVLSPLPPPLDEDEREAEAVITGAGNEEIWRRPDQ
ncbi:MAG: filamentous hemagglutinin N-terminal domain-containing protein [Phenylobacterium sp.]|uniref:filamentous hemagglutinin N-terminal domain-containing protein n=1 Tax=Phenylobacterium sp. TaxID=1871053 RepID=UPI001A57D1FE|nr:filamentous hemagglutinin N-terminal domain-containing protein [Phenylobacterium sp.]MBL8553215.1 filamentous hemagglutinin N-terminal domain-containing protein [Phenylobacterium sp.]